MSLRKKYDQFFVIICFYMEAIKSHGTFNLLISSQKSPVYK